MHTAHLMLLTGWSYPELRSTPRMHTRLFLMAKDVQNEYENDLIERRRLLGMGG